MDKHTCETRVYNPIFALTMYFQKIKPIIYLSLVSILCSCVSAKIYEELKSDKEKMDKDYLKLQGDHQTLEFRNEELLRQLMFGKKEFAMLLDDTTTLGKELRKTTSEYEELNSSYERLLSNHSSETKKLMLKLRDSKVELEERIQKLKELETTLNGKEKRVRSLKDSLMVLNNDLRKREMKVGELEAVLNQKDSVVNDLKNAVAQALLGFKDKGLSVELKNGKVYVSLEEQLLFRSGSYTIDIKGEEALKQLATVLAAHHDINILIEGHTDDVPYKGSGAIKDNWDLSSKRATAVVRILTKNGVNPSQLIPAGRSEYAPLEEGKTPAIRKKNRRIEIILTPKLDELFQILESN